MIDWPRETQLDDSLRFDAPLVDTLSPRVILFTGTTGFLGANLLSEVLRRTKARALCLVRAADSDSGRARLRDQLELLGLPGPDERVEVIAGDLTKPRLGLDPGRYEALAEEVECIYHIGAAINFLRPYRALRPANVGGTQAMIELATRTRMKPLHHVSSLAVFFGQDRDRISEHDEPTVEGLRTGYAQTKWVAEQHVMAARRQGLPAVIYRTGRISADSRTGATSSWNDLINRLIRACVALGSYPTLDINILLTPVDFICAALVALSRDRRARGRSFHLLNPNSLRWADIVGALEVSGYPLRPLDFGDWLAALKYGAADHSRARPERESLGRLWMALASGRALLEPRPDYETPDSGPLLAEAGLSCPQFGLEQLATSIRFMVSAGYLPAPRTTRV